MGVLPAHDGPRSARSTRRGHHLRRRPRSPHVAPATGPARAREGARNVLPRRAQRRRSPRPRPRDRRGGTRDRKPLPDARPLPDAALLQAPGSGDRGMPGRPRASRRDPSRLPPPDRDHEPSPPGRASRPGIGLCRLQLPPPGFRESPPEGAEEPGPGSRASRRHRDSSRPATSGRAGRYLARGSRRNPRRVAGDGASGGSPFRTRRFRRHANRSTRSWGLHVAGIPARLLGRRPASPFRR